MATFCCVCSQSSVACPQKHTDDAKVRIGHFLWHTFSFVVFSQGKCRFTSCCVCVLFSTFPTAHFFSSIPTQHPLCVFLSSFFIPRCATLSIALMLLISKLLLPTERLSHVSDPLCIGERCCLFCIFVLSSAFGSRICIRAASFECSFLEWQSRHSHDEEVQPFCCMLVRLFQQLVVNLQISLFDVQ